MCHVLRRSIICGKDRKEARVQAVPITKTARIFIVEDEAFIAMELEDRLSGLGYSVCGHAASGERAFEQIPELEPDLVLMDINLTGREP